MRGDGLGGGTGVFHRPRVVRLLYVRFLRVTELMSTKFILEFLLAAGILSVSCSSLSGLDFNMNTASPQRNYRVKLEGKGGSVTSSVQQVKLTAFKGTETVLIDDRFYRQDVDHPFSAEYPVGEWLSDSILRLGKRDSAQISGDKIVVVNGGENPVDVLKVEYGSLGEKFIIFDLMPRARVELRVLPYSDSGQYPNPNVSYSAYANGQLSGGMAKGWRETEAASEILIEIGKPSGAAKSNNGLHPTAIQPGSHPLT